MNKSLLLLLATAALSVPGAKAQVSTDTISTTGYGQQVTRRINTIDKSEMNNKDQATNAIEAIRGRVAGLTVERNSTNALSAVRLRGTSSLTGGNDPLIIVDGVMGDISLLESIYPTDIESFTIMKDAAETSQYGSRGAAGVIEVTTMRGKAGQMRVNYNGSVGFHQVYKRLNMMDANQYREFGKQQGISILDRGANTNFQKAIERTGFWQQHHLAFQGGSEQSNYRVSLGVVQELAVIKRIQDHTFMSNMNMTQMMFDGLLRIDIGMFGSTGKEQNIYDEQKLFYSAAAFNPTIPSTPNEDGSYYGYALASQISNPMVLLDRKDDNESSHISTHAKLTFNLTPHLKFTLFGAYTYSNKNIMQYLPSTAWNKGQAYRSAAKTESLLGNAMLSYNKTFGAHALSLMGLAELQQQTYSGHFVTVTNFSTDKMGYDDLSAGALRPWGGTDSYFERPKMASFLGRASYTYDNRYTIGVTARYDGSSKFGDNNKWGFFPAVSASWNVTNEKFMKNQTIFDDLKVGIGFGISGNQGSIDSYTTLALVQPNGFVPVGNANLVSYSNLKNNNPNLKWEVSKTINGSIDAKMLDGRLLVSLSTYRTWVSDMLYAYAVSTPPFISPTVVANIGSMQNRGIELSVGGTPLVTKDMELTVNANLTYQKNKLVSLSGYYNGEYLTSPQVSGIAKMDGAGFHGGDNDVTKQVVGQPLGVFLMKRCNGLIYNETVKGYEYDTSDKAEILGQAMPKFLLGSNISFRYKDFDITLQANGAFGHKIFNGTSLTYMDVTAFPLYNIFPEAPEKNIKDQVVSDYWLENGNYVNIDYITVGWRVPLRQNRFVQKLRLSLTMNNVATFTAYSGLTPMINSSALNGTLGLDDKRSYPLYHTYTLGVSVTF